MTNASRKRAGQPSTSDNADRTEVPTQPSQPSGPVVPRITQTGLDDELEDHEPTQSTEPTSSRTNRPPGSVSGSDIYVRDAVPLRGIERFQEDEHQQSRDRLTSFVEQYRDRTISKTKALVSIAGAVEGSTSLSEIEKDKTIKLYLDELDSIRRESTDDFVAQLRNK